MKQEISLQSVQAILANAILLGMEVAKSKYRSPIFDEENKNILLQINNLNSSVEKFISENSIENISLTQLLPLMEEIREIALKKEN